MFEKVESSLKDLLGERYVNSLKACNVRLFGADPQEMDGLLDERVDFFPEEFEKKLDEDLAEVGNQVIPPFKNDMDGAATDAFKNATHANMSPVGGKGFLPCWGRRKTLSDREERALPCIGGT